MSLRLVGSEPPKVKPKRRKHQRSVLLSPDEEARFRAAMKNLHGAFGSWPCLASAMRMRTNSIACVMRGAAHVSGDMIVRAMLASGLTFAELIGGPVAADRCRACGAVRRAS